MAKYGFACPITKPRQIASALAQSQQKDASFFIPNSGQIIYNSICEHIN
ncbi:MAG: hypothetical protein J6A98_00870 [Clostridia bacterium]|nr:hypothetical protein [Clostridia bacterium]